LPALASRFCTTMPGVAFGPVCTSLERKFAPLSSFRLPPITPDQDPYPKLSLDDSVGPDVLQKLGVRAIRMSCGYVPTTDAHYASAMEQLNQRLREFSSRNITVMLMFLSGPHTPQPLGRGRPHLDENGLLLDTKQDLAWEPRYDADFQAFVAHICKTNGFPKGPVTAVELWNEPWDGVSISGWGADEPRFRELYTHMAQGVEEARQTGAVVLLAGCDSSTNTIDKLFSDGKDTFLKWFDVCTIHYQGICAPVLYKAWLNRQSPYGRVKVWDTESWVANTDDRVATVVAGDRAAGYDRNMGIFGGNISTENKQDVILPDGSKKQIDTFHVWSTAAAVGAAQHFIGERSFRELLFKDGLPWIMLFDGLNQHPDDGTVVVVGDLKGAFGEDNLLFRGVPWPTTGTRSRNIPAFKAVSFGNGSITGSNRKPRRVKSTGPTVVISVTSLTISTLFAMAWYGRIEHLIQVSTNSSISPNPSRHLPTTRRQDRSS
jgi:hypothetical protein